MKRSIKKFMLTALLLCVTVLLGSCSFLEGEQQPQVQNYSELTQTEVFPVRLEIGEQSYLISSRPHSFAVLSADLAQALEDMGVASMITALCSDAPAGISSSGLGAGLHPDAPEQPGTAGAGGAAGHPV